MKLIFNICFIFLLLLNFGNTLTNETMSLVLYDNSNREKAEYLIDLLEKTKGTVRKVNLDTDGSSIPLITDFEGPLFGLVCIVADDISNLEYSSFHDIIRYLSYIPWHTHANMENVPDYDPTGLLLFVNNGSEKLKSFLNNLRISYTSGNTVETDINLDMIPRYTQNILNISHLHPFKLGQSICFDHFPNSKNPLNYSFDILRTRLNMEDEDKIQYCSVGIAVQEPNTSDRVAIFGNTDIIDLETVEKKSDNEFLSNIIEWVAHDRNMIRVKSLEFTPKREQKVYEEEEGKFYVTDTIQAIINLEYLNSNGTDKSWVPYQKSQSAFIKMIVSFLENKKEIDFIPTNTMGEYRAEFSNFDQPSDDETNEKKYGVYEFDIQFFDKGMNIINIEKTITLTPNIKLFKNIQEIKPYFLFYCIYVTLTIFAAAVIFFSPAKK